MKRRALRKIWGRFNFCTYALPSIHCLYFINAPKNYATLQLDWSTFTWVFSYSGWKLDHFETLTKNKLIFLLFSKIKQAFLGKQFTSDYFLTLAQHLVNARNFLTVTLFREPVRPVERHETFPGKCKFTLCRKYRVRLLFLDFKFIFLHKT